MSLRHLADAFGLTIEGEGEIPNSELKLVLLVLADMSDTDGRGRCTIEELSVTTCMGIDETRETVRTLDGEGYIGIMSEHRGEVTYMVGVGSPAPSPRQSTPGATGPDQFVANTEDRVVSDEKHLVSDMEVVSVPPSEGECSDLDVPGGVIKGGAPTNREVQDGVRGQLWLESTDTSDILNNEYPPANGERILDPESERRFVGFLTGLYVSAQRVRPANKDIQKQAAKLRQIVKDYEVRHIAEAWKGMSLVWPFSDGRPWDAFDLSRKFNEARQLVAEVGELVVSEEGWDEWLT